MVGGRGGAVGPRVCSSGTRKWIAELISWEQMQFEWSASLTHMFGPPTYEKTKLESHTASMATIIYTFKWTFSFISHARTKMQLDNGFFVHNVFFFFFGASRFKTWLNWAERTSSFFFFWQTCWTRRPQVKPPSQETRVVRRKPSVQKLLKNLLCCVPVDVEPRATARTMQIP